jgi:hypothetical protein
MGPKQNPGAGRARASDYVHPARANVPKLTPVPPNCPASAGAFTYDTFDASVAATLWQQGAEVRVQVRHITPVIVEIGRNLIAEKQNLDHGQFCNNPARCGAPMSAAAPADVMATATVPVGVALDLVEAGDRHSSGGLVP